MSENQEKCVRKPTKIDQMTKEQIKQAIVKKRECNAKAQKIIENLLDKSICEQYFVNCLPDINQSHFEDVIEERSIVQLCGYPLCDNDLTTTEIPKQKYKISTKTNKVYDISARKSFCSNSCYNAAMHIKNQMLTSPLWFREYENIPKFTLLPKKVVGAPGQEIDVSIVEKIEIKSDKFTTINDFVEASLDEPPDSENTQFKIDYDKETDTVTTKTYTKTSKKDESNHIENSKTKTIGDPHSLPVQKQEDKLPHKTTTINEKINAVKPIKNPLNIVGDIIEKPEIKIDPILVNKPVKPEMKTKTKKLQQKKQPAIAVVTAEVEKSLAEWITIDTLLFLLGEAKLKELIVDKGDLLEKYLENFSQTNFYNSNIYDQYQALCRKLNMLELDDRKINKQNIRETKPLPDYSILKEESKGIQLKVKAFLAGDTNIPSPSSNIESNEPETESVTYLPLVDKTSQNALRRKIVCEHLVRVLPDILRSLGLSTLSIISDVRLLVNTFKLKPNNIMFKPIQWTLITIIIIKLLSLRDQTLNELLQQPTAYQNMQLLLLSFKQDGGYLDRLISWLIDVDRLLEVKDDSVI